MYDFFFYISFWYAALDLLPHKMKVSRNRLNFYIKIQYTRRLFTCNWNEYWNSKYVAVDWLDVRGSVGNDGWSYQNFKMQILIHSFHKLYWILSKAFVRIYKHREYIVNCDIYITRRKVYYYLDNYMYTYVQSVISIV